MLKFLKYINCFYDLMDFFQKCIVCHLNVNLYIKKIQMLSFKFQSMWYGIDNALQQQNLVNYSPHFIKVVEILNSIVKFFK